MIKILTADKVRRLPVGTDVRIVREADGSSGMMWVTKTGNRKVLKGVVAMHEIVDMPGWHYEIVQEDIHD